MDSNASNDASNDASTLQNALGVLSTRFGQRLNGSQQSAEAELRRALQEEMGLDEGNADRVVKKLAQTGRLAYQGTREVGTEPGTSTTGPVISLPGTTVSSGSGEFISTANPALMMGLANNPGGGGNVGGAGVGAPATAAALTDPDAAGADAERNVAVNNQGATMGQLDDTNVEARSAPITVGEREEMDEDRTEGFWRIG